MNMLALGALGVLSLEAERTTAAAADTEPRILTCIAGLHRCLGVKDAEQGARFGCEVYNASSCSGPTTPELCGVRSLVLRWP